ncbi:MAG: class I adenylate-forming enzyme family protein [Acidimicrobiales bacterium]
MLAPEEEGIPHGTRIEQVADERPGEIGLVFAAEDGSVRQLTYEEIDVRSTQLAHLLVDRGLGVGDFLAVCLRNSPEHLIACFAGWKAGAGVVPMRWDLPDWELQRLRAVLGPKVSIDQATLHLLDESGRAPTERLPEVVPEHGWGVCSSGSTGSPKVIVQRTPALYFPSQPSNTVVEHFNPIPKPQRVLVPAPLYHTNGFTAVRNLMAGDQVVLLERFNAPRIYDLVEQFEVTGFIAATPMLQRLAQVPGFEHRDLSSLDWVQQGASLLPIWLGRLWAELLGPERFYLSYGSSENAGLVVCRGDEWMARPGTLGRGLPPTEVKILGADGEELAPGEVGGIYMRIPGGPGAMYVGDVPPMPSTPDGFYTVGDLGWLDEDGYLFMADRRTDMIVSGAANVFPAEVEAALSEHPGIEDVVVIGLRDPEWGRRVHALVVARPDADRPDAEDVIAFARQRLAAYKIPKSVEFVDHIPRSEAMKINRAQLVAEREDPEDDAAEPAAAGGPAA